MRKMFFVILIITAISSFYFAQPSSVIADETKVFIGTIESFRPVFARPPKWPIARFTAVADNGERIEVYVLGRDTTVIDVDGKSIENKRPRVGKKVEIKYSTGEYEIYGGMRYEAISIRYVPADYVSQPTTTTGQPNVTAQAAATANAYGEKIFIGKIESSSPTFRIPPKRKIVVVSDNGDKLTVFISREIAIRDMHAYPTRIGKRAEVKYSPAENGDNEAISFRYVPSDYVQQPATPVVSTQTPAATTARQGNIFIGKVEKVTPTFHHIELSQPRSKILAIADNGEQLLFFVPGTCTVTDVSGQNMSKGGYHGSILLKKGQRIEVKYSTITNGNSITNGQPGAESIRRLD